MSIDGRYIGAIWQNLPRFHKQCATYVPDQESEYRMLEVGQSDVHENACDVFPSNVKVDTLDINPGLGPQILGDITKHNDCIEDETYDFVSCCEVLEHTSAPWDAPKEIWRMLKWGGYVFVSTPLNLELHPPLPDYWRFTEYGLRELFKDFEILVLDNIHDSNRKGFPIQHTMIGRKVETENKTKEEN